MNQSPPRQKINKSPERQRDQNLRQQIKDILVLIVTKNSTENDIEDGKKMLMDLEQKYDFNTIFKEISDQIEENIDLFDEENSMNLIKYLENQSKDKLKEKLKQKSDNFFHEYGYEQIKITQEDQQFVSKLFNNNPSLKDIVGGITGPALDDISQKKGTLSTLKSISEIQKLQNKFKLCYGATKIYYFIINKRKNFFKKSFNYLKLIFGQKNKKIFERILRKKFMIGFYGIKAQSRLKTFQFNNFKTALQNIQLSLQNKLLYYSLIKIRDRQFKLKLIKKKFLIFFKYNVGNMHHTFKKLISNMQWERKKKLPSCISQILIIFEHNLIRKYTKKWRSHTSQRNSYLIKRMTKLIQNKLNQTMKIGYYQIAYQYKGRFQKDPSKVTLQIKGKILQSLRIYENTLTCQQAFIRWQFRSVTSHIGNCLKEISMHAKLNPQIILWRFQNQLTKNRPSKKITKIKRKNTALFQLIRAYNFIVQKRYTQVMDKIKKLMPHKYVKNGKVFSAFQFLINIFNKKNYKYSFEKVKFVHFLRLGLKLEFLEAAEILSIFQNLYFKDKIINQQNLILLKQKFDQWHDYLKIVKLKQRFLQILLNTQLGSVLNVFTQWQNVPDLRAQKLKNDTLKMLDILNIFSRRKLSKSFNLLNDKYEEGIRQQQKICMVIFDVSCNKFLKSFYLWYNDTINHNCIRQCSNTLNIMEIIHIKINQNFQIILENDRIKTLKNEAINIMLQKFKQGLSNKFKLWSRNAKLATLKSSKVEDLIAIIKNYIKRSDNNELYNIFQKFRKNSSLQKRIKQFYESILHTRFGSAHRIFILMKGLPDKSNKNLTNIFQNKISLYCNKKINKQSFQYMKKQIQDGEGLLRNSLISLIQLTTGNQKRLFLMWRNMNTQKRTVLRCRLTTLFLNSISQQILTNTQIIFGTNWEYELKKNTILKLFLNHDNKLKSVLKQWKKNSASLKQQLQLLNDFKNLKEKDTINLLILKLKKSQKNQLKKTLQLFSKNSIIYKIMIEFYNNVLNISNGRVYKVFLVIKSLPSRIDNINIIKCNKFENKLKNYLNSKLKLSFSLFQQDFIQGDAQKQYIMMDIIKQTMNGQQKSFKEWYSSTKKWISVKQCINVQNLFENINSNIKNQQQIFLNNGEQKRKKKIIKLLILNSSNKLKNAFMKYKSQVRKKTLELKISQEDKNHLIRVFNQFINLNNKKQIRDIIDKFKINQQIQSIKQSLFKKLNSSIVLLPLQIFRKIENLPQRKDYEKIWKKNTVQSRLENFVTLNLRRNSYNYFQQNHTQGNKEKNFMLVQMIQATVGKNKVYLQKWRQINFLKQEHLRMRQVMNSFFSLNQILQERFTLIQDSNKNEKIKEQIVLKIFQQGNNKLRNYFLIWNQQSKLSKISELMKKKDLSYFTNALKNFNQSNKKFQLRQILNQFKNNRLFRKYGLKIMNVLLNTSKGKQQRIFKLWKFLPNKINQKSIDRTNQLQEKLERIYQVKLNQVFGPMKNIYQKCQHIKIKFILALSFKNQNQNDQNLTIVLYKFKQNKLYDTANKIQSSTQQLQVQLFQKQCLGLANFFLSKSYNCLYTQNLEAIQIKKNILKTFAIKTDNQQSKMLQRWNLIAQNNKQILCLRKTIQFFSDLNKHIRQDLNLITQTNNEFNIKTQVIEKMVQKIKNLINCRLLKWKQNAIMSRINADLKEQQKNLIIKSMQKFIGDSNKQLLRNILNLFQKNNLIQKQVQQISQKFLKMTSGRIYELFLIWKNLPKRINYNQNNASNQLQNNLNQLYMRRVTLVNNMLQEYGFQGSSIKIKIVNQLLQTTGSQQRNLFMRWKKQKEQTLIINRSRITIDLFENLNLNMMSKISLINSNTENKQNQIKLQVLQKLLFTQRKFLQDILRQWKIIAMVMKISQDQQNENKLILINRMKLYLQQNNNQSLRIILDKFNHNSRIKSILYQICRKLNQTVGGQAQILFNKWNSIPLKMQNKQSAFFEQYYLLLLKRRQSMSLQYLKFDKLQAQQRIRSICKQILIKTQSKQQQYFQLWHEQSRDTRVVLRCNQMEIFMKNLNKLLNLKFSNTFYDVDGVKFDHQVFVINRLKYLTANIEKYFYQWIQNTKIKNIQVKMSNDLKQYFNQRLQKYLDMAYKSQIRKILHKFHRNYKNRYYNRKIIEYIMDQKYGKIYSTFQQWISLPYPFFMSKNKKLLYTTPTPNEDQIYEENQKRKMLNLWLYKILKPEKKALITWKKQLKNYKQLQIIKQITLAFDCLNKQFTTNFQVLVDNERAATIKQQIIQKMLKNHQNSKNHYLNKWLFNAQLKKVQTQISSSNKEFFQDKFNLFLKNRDGQSYRAILSKFQKNKNQQKMIQFIFNKIMLTKGGQLFNHFVQWKGIPQRRNYKLEDMSNKFQKSISNALNKIIKQQSYQFFLNFNNEGKTKQKETCMYFIHKNELKTKKLMNIWINSANNLKNAKKFRSVSNLIQFINNQILANLGMVIQKQNNRLKEKTIRQMIHNSSSMFRNYFKQWRENSRIISLQKNISQQISDDLKKILINSLNKAINNEKTSKLRMALSQFHNNKFVIKTQKQILNKIWKRYFGSVFKCFSNWKNIPQRIPTEKVNKLQKSLMNFVVRSINIPIIIFKKQFKQTKNYQQMCLQSFIQKTKSKYYLMFQNWRNMSQRCKTLELCKKTVQFFSKISDVQKQTLMILLRNNKEHVKMQRAIERLTRVNVSSMQRAFKKWSFIKQINSIKDQFDDEKKQKIIQHLIQFKQKNNKEQKIKALEKFYQQFRLKNISLKFFNQIMNGGSGRAFKLFKTIKNLPKKKNYKEISICNIYSKKILSYYIQKLNLSFWKFKLDYTQGDIQRRRNIQTLVLSQNDLQKTLFSKWRNLSKTQKCYSQSKQLFTFMFNINQTLISNIIYQFGLTEQIVAIKTQVINKMFINYQNILKQNLLKWLQNTKQINIQRQMQEFQKQQVISCLQEFLNHNQKSQLKISLEKFFQFSRNHQIQTRFMKNILNLSLGKAFKFILQLKSIPERKDNEKLKKLNFFQQGLFRLYQKNLGISHQILIDDSQQGRLMINNCTTQIINLTTGKLKFRFQLWKQYIKAIKEIMKGQKVLNLLYNLNSQIKCSLNFQQMQKQNKQNKIQESTIFKIIQNSNKLKSDAFKLWNEFSKMTNFNNQISNQAKICMINNLQQFLRYNIKQQYSNVLHAFYFNYRIKRIQFQFFTNILQSQTGRILKLHTSWQKIPEKKDYLQINRINAYVKNIMGIYGRKLNLFFNACRNSKIDGKNLKQRILANFLHASDSKLNKNFSKWKNLTKFYQQTIKVKKTIDLLKNISEICKTNLLQGLFMSQRQQLLLQQSLKQIYQNIQLRIRTSFKKWVVKVQQIKISQQLGQEQKNRAFLVFQNAINKNNNESLRKILRKFKNNYKVNSISFGIFYKMIQSTFEQMGKLLQKMKNLPNKKDEQLSIKTNKLEFILYKIGHSTIKKAFQNLISNRQIGESSLQRIVFIMIEKTQGKNKYLFQKWHQITQRNQNLTQCKKTIEFIQQLQQMMVSNIIETIKVNKNRNIMESAMRRMIDNANNMQAKIFNKWKILTRTNIIQNQMDEISTQQCVQGLIHYLNGTQKNVFRKLLDKFKINSQIKKITSNFFRNLNTKNIGPILIFYQIWKNLPNKFDKIKNNNRSSFQYKLNQFVNKTINQDSFNYLRIQNLSVIDTKKFSLDKLFRKSKGKFHNIFLKWNRIVKQQKDIAIFKELNNLFANINHKLNNDILNNGFGLQLQGDYQQEYAQYDDSLQKHFAMRKIFTNMYHLKHFALELMKHDYKKYQTKQKFQSKFILINVLNNLFKSKKRIIIFDLIQYCQLIVNKNSCNSIWRWRLSNIDKNYQNKTDLLYKQSQFIVKFCQIFEQQRINMESYGFNNIKLQLISQNVLKNLFQKGERYFRRLIDIQFYKWKGICQYIRLQEVNKKQKLNQYGNSCTDIIQKLINRRTNFFFKRFLKKFNLIKYNDLQTSMGCLHQFYLSILSSSLSKIKKRGVVKSNPQIAFGIISYFILRKSAKYFFVQLRQMQNATDLRAMEIYSILENYQIKIKKQAFFKLQRIIIFLKKMVGTFQKLKNNIIKDAIELTQQYVFSSKFKSKMRSLICFENLNSWIEKKLLHETINFLQSTDQYLPVLVDHPWLMRSIKYLAKNVKINPQISLFRLIDYAKYKEKRIIQAERYPEISIMYDQSRVIDHNQSRFYTNDKRYPDISIMNDNSRVIDNYRYPDILIVNDNVRAIDNYQNRIAYKTNDNVLNVLNNSFRSNLNASFSQQPGNNLNSSFSQLTGNKTFIMHLRSILKKIIDRSLFQAMVNLKKFQPSSLPHSILNSQQNNISIHVFNHEFSQPISPILSPNSRKKSLTLSPKQKEIPIPNFNKKQLSNLPELHEPELSFAELPEPQLNLQLTDKQNNILIQQQLLDVDELMLDKQELIERDTQLLKQVKKDTEYNENLREQLTTKDDMLQEAFQSISQLHTRLNYMITSRVINIFARIREDNLYFAFAQLKNDDY